MTPRPRVSLCVKDAALNCLGRAALLAELLAPEYDVEVLGLRSGPPWAPASGTPWESHFVPSPAPGEIPAALDALGARARGQVVVACKPWPSVLRLARAALARGGAGVVDIDDWELGWFLPLGPRQLLHHLLRAPGAPDHLLATWRAEAEARRWPTRLVSNRFLERRFGGTWIPHACDTDALDPAQAPPREEACRGLELDPTRRWVGFVGTPARHKGLDLLLDALRRLARPALGLVLVGGGAPAAELARGAPDLVTVRPPIERTRRRDALAALDVVALPQRDTPATRGQMPAKVYDALAMRVPVVASATGDLPEVLEGVGEVVPPGDVAALAEALARVLDDPARAAARAEAGRRRCVERYSYAAVGPRLRRLFASLPRASAV